MRSFGLKTEEVTGDWRKLRYEKLHNVYSFFNIVTVVKWRRTDDRRMSKINLQSVLVAEPEGTTLVCRPSIYGRIILKLILSSV
jgi:hypothetical protein